MFSIAKIFTSGVLLLVFDFVYIRFTSSYFKRQIKEIQGSPLTLRWIPAVLCYILLILGLNYFILLPKRSAKDAFFLGILIYGVYETTNAATFAHWKMFTVLMDTLWGGTLFALTTYLFYYIQNI